MSDIVTPFANIPDYTFWEQLAKLNEKRKVLFAPPPLKKVNNPMVFNHCFVCNKMTPAAPVLSLSLSVCAKCYKNRTNVTDFKHQTMISTYDTCAICGKFFVNGVVVINVPLCDLCRVYTTNVIRKSFGLEPFRVSW